MIYHMDLFIESEFPKLDVIDYHKIFKEKICYFYFNLIRKLKESLVTELQNQLTDTLILLKTCIASNKEYTPYLLLFYKMLCQTRDISGGKGEQQISYMFLMVFYDIYPILAIYALYRFVQPIDGNERPYGSWRDIKYLCEFISIHSLRGKKHGLIGVCINLINKQLEIDLKTWNFSKSISKKHISNVAKWIPREHKRFDWLYELLVIEWEKKNNSYLFNTLNHTKSLSKAKQSYRKKVSLLNNALNTTEIKLCSQKWDEIIPNEVAWHTLMKQPKLIYNCDSDNYKLCSDLIRKRITGEAIFSGNSDFSNFFPISFLIKEAIGLIGSPKTDKIIIINKIWARYTKTISRVGFDNILPILDSSFLMQATNSEPYYQAIGIAILVAERTNLGKRILVVDYQSTWVNLEGIDNFISMVERIFHSVASKTNTIFNFQSALVLLIYSFLQSKSTKRFIKNLSLLLLSDFNHNFNVESCKIFLNSYCYNSPQFIFWNFATNNCVQCFNDENIILISGFGNNIVNTLGNLVNKIEDKNHNSDYQNVCFLLNNKRYNVLENYFYSLMK